MKKESNKKDTGVKHINLALQGGGSHGAFTWGVLDRILEDDRIAIEGISGTSAGSMNGVVLASGLIHGGKLGARQKLEEFWKRISIVANGYQVAYHENPFTPYLRDLEKTYTQGVQKNFFLQMFELMLQNFSPYQFNPYNHNPIRDIIHDMVDFKVFHKHKAVKFFVGATNVETNRIKIFGNEDMNIEVVLASACLPTLYQAVKVGEEYFWDGGFIGNPILEPLIYNCASRDLMIIQVNPINRPGVPKTPREISGRLNEVTFNSSLMREIRSIVNIRKLSESQICKTSNPYYDLHLHNVHDETFMATLGASSKYNTDWDFLKSLMERGRQAASRWLEIHFEHLGKQTTMDLERFKLETPSSQNVKLEVTD